MKRYSNLYTQIHDFANLELAYRKARRCKRYHNEVLRYSAHKEENLVWLQKRLMAHTYKQGPYRTFTVKEPKKRQIAALPFPDRVAQHAINNIIEPLLDKRFYFHSYACRKGKGMHKASETLTRWIHNLSFEGAPIYAIKADIHQYFKSIDHGILKERLRRIIKDKETLALLAQIIDAGGGDTGIPVGNLTSQLFANLYLDALDKFIKDELHIKHYIRYMDDFVILHHDKLYLWGVLRTIELFLREKLALELNPKTAIVAAKNSIDFCGYRHWKDHKTVRKSSVRRMYRKISAYHRGKFDPEAMGKTLTSWLGHVQHADTYSLRQKVMCRLPEFAAKKE